MAGINHKANQSTLLNIQSLKSASLHKTPIFDQESTRLFLILLLETNEIADNAIIFELVPSGDGRDKILCRVL